MKMKRAFLVLAMVAMVCLNAVGADKVSSYLARSDEWFRGDEATKIAGNILSWQTEVGDWPKNTNTAAARFEGDRAKLKGTFDNSATIPELRFLARAFVATKKAEYEKAFLKGLDHVLAAQYANGGWPQSFPVSKGYDRHITFNDDCMVNIMNFVRDVGRDKVFDFVDADRRAKARAEFEKGIDCILKCQVRVDGKLTAWCAQHDEVDLSPAKARSYELPSLSGSESAGIVRLLMSLERPNAQVIESVDAAVKWFEAVELTGIKQVMVPDPKAPKGMDKHLIEDASAPPLWARFYDLKTMKPMFVDRDGVPKEKLSDIGYERRNGYAWLGTWPASVLSEYPKRPKKP
ncbi:MAG TPA: pectate lyase [Verrucomicrobiae bacterium]